MGWCQQPPSKSSPLALGSITLSCFFSAWKAGSVEGNPAWAFPLRETLLLRPQAHLHRFFLMPPPSQGVGAGVKQCVLKGDQSPLHLQPKSPHLPPEWDCSTPSPRKRSCPGSCGLTSPQQRTGDYVLHLLRAIGCLITLSCLV